MKRHRSRRSNDVAKLNLVALMDIFTILVFFLMVNSSDVQIKETHQSVALPESTTTDLPENTLKLYITNSYMFFEDSNVQIPLNTFSEETGTFPDLVAALEAQALKDGQLPESFEDKGRPITILGDQQTDYATIQKVLASCAQTSFRDVSLAVIFEEGAEGLESTEPVSVSQQTTNSSDESLVIANANLTDLNRL